MSSSLSWGSEIFGETLQGKDGPLPVETALKDAKAIGIYFSAHWCPPCRGFTPKLAEWYNKDLKGKGLEIVFVSSDRDQRSFDDYFAEQPWLALPYEKRELKDKLSKKYKVEGIPTFIVLDAATGQITTRKGRERVASDPTGEDLPWHPLSVQKLLGTEFIRKEAGSSSTQTFGIAELDGKKIGLYFSAHWCPPCRQFTPKLIQAYQKLQARGEKFEIIFVSSDRDQDSFDEYFGEMPWSAIPHSDRKRHANLNEHFDVDGIPCLVMLDEKRDVITKSAVGRVRADAECAKFPWLPELMNDIDENAEGIDEAPALVVLHETRPEEEQAKNKSVIMPLAEKYRAEAAAEGKEEQDFYFFVASKEDGELAKRVRSECGGMTDYSQTKVVLLELQDNGAFYPFPEGKDFTRENLTAFLADFTAKKLERKQMGA